MKQEIIIAGFGGQGVLSMGKILAYSGLMEDDRLLPAGQQLESRQTGRIQGSEDVRGSAKCPKK